MADLDTSELRFELEAAPAWALFSEEYVAAARGLSIHQVRLERKRGTGVPFSKDGRRVLYSKRDILEYIERLRFMAMPWDEQYLRILPASWLSKLGLESVSGLLRGDRSADTYLAVAHEFLDHSVAINDLVGVRKAQALIELVAQRGAAR